MQFEEQKRIDRLARRTMVDNCPPETSLRSRQYQSPIFTFVTIVKPTGHVDADVPFFIPIPTRLIVVVSTRNANLSDSLFLSFTPLNLYGTPSALTGAIAWTPVGTEQWLPLSPFSATAKSKIGCGWLFKDPLPVGTMYLQIGQENGGAANVPITFALAQEGAVLNWHVGNQS